MCAMGDDSTRKQEIDRAAAAKGDEKKADSDGGQADEIGSPLIQIVQTIQDAEKPQEKAPKPHRDLHDWLMLAFVFLAFLAAAFAAHYTSKEANIAEQALTETKDTAIAQIRPYVSVRTFPQVWAIQGAPELRVDLINGGVTPATNIRVRGSLEVRIKDPVEFLGLPEITQIDVIEASNATQVLNLFRRLRPMTGDERASILDGTKAKIYAWGVVLYDDVLDRTHHTYFYYSFHGIREYTDQIPPVNNGLRSGNRQPCPHPKND